MYSQKISSYGVQLDIGTAVRLRFEQFCCASYNATNSTAIHDILTHNTLCLRQLILSRIEPLELGPFLYFYIV